jgi:hypothetical protein
MGKEVAGVVILARGMKKTRETRPGSRSALAVA